MADLSPESKEIYDLLMAETREAYEESFLAHKKRILDSVKSFVTNKQFKTVRESIESVNDALGTEIGDARVHGPAVVSASSTERSAASLHAPSSATSNPTTPDASRAVLDAKRDSSKDDLTPGARRIYDLLVGGSVAPASSMSLCTSSSAVPTGDHEPAAATSTPASPLDVSRAHSTSGAISTCAATTTCVPRVIPLDSTPTLVPAGTAAPEWNLHYLTPSNCSTICPGSNASTTTSTLYQAAVPAPSASPKHHLMVDVDITTTELTWVTTDICSMGCFDGAANSVEINNTNTMSPTLGNFNFTHVLLGSNGVAPTLKQVRAQPTGGILDVFSILRRSSSSLIFAEVCPSSAEKVQHSLILEELTPGLSLEMHLLVLVVMRKVALFWPVLQSARCNTVILVTWDPGVLMNGMCANFHGLVLKSTQLVLWATKSPWPPPPFNNNTTCRIEIRFCRFSSQVAELFLFCCPACSILNLHRTMDTKQISGDWLFSTTMELQWDATLTVITFDLGVQCVRLQPTVFKWSDHSCYDTNYLLAGAKVNREILLVRRAACTLWISCCLDNLHCSLRITSTLAILEWVISNPWPPPELQFLLSIVVLQPTRVGELQPWAHAFDIECEHLHWPCFLQETCHFMFSDVAVPSLVHAEREGWFQFCSAGKASLYSYGPAQFEWEIAWPPATLAYSIHYGMHMYLSLECSIVICYLESEIKCVPHMHWDPGGFSEHWLGVKTNFRKFAWLLMGSYLASSISGRSELVTLRKSMPPLNQLMLNVYHTFSPGTPIEVGLLNDSLVQDWLICLSGHIIQYGFEVAQWKIAWFFLWEYFDAGNKSRYFIPAATLTYPGTFLGILASGHSYVSASFSHKLSLKAVSWLKLRPTATTPTLSSSSARPLQSPLPP